MNRYSSFGININEAPISLDGIITNSVGARLPYSGNAFVLRTARLLKKISKFLNVIRNLNDYLKSETDNEKKIKVGWTA